MGKTTLWRNGVDDARDNGFDVLPSTPASGETQLSFAVLSDLVGSRVAEVRDELPAPQLRAIEAALLLDEPERRRRAATDNLRGDAHPAARARRETSLLIAIDDIQWLDESSIEALAFCFRRFGDARVSALLARRTDADSFAHAALEAPWTMASDLMSNGWWSARCAQIGDPRPHPRSARTRLPAQPHRRASIRVRRQSVLRARDSTSARASIPGPRAGLRAARAGHAPADGPIAARRPLAADARPARRGGPAVGSVARPARAAGVRGSVDDAVSAGVLEITGESALRFAHPLFASPRQHRARSDCATRASHAAGPADDGEERARHLALGA